MPETPNTFGHLVLGNRFQGCASSNRPRKLSAHVGALLVHETTRKKRDEKRLEWYCCGSRALFIDFRLSSFTYCRIIDGIVLFVVATLFIILQICVPGTRMNQSENEMGGNTTKMERSIPATQHSIRNKNNSFLKN